MKKSIYILFATILLSVMSLAQADSNPLPFTVTVPQKTPVLTSITPSTAKVGDPAVTLAVVGSNFDPLAKCFFNNVQLTTVFNSATSLTCTIPTNLLVVPSGQSTAKYDVIVRNPVTVSLTWNPPISGSPTGYNVYRNGDKLTSNPLASLSYDDAVYGGVSYIWGVTAVYPQGESVQTKTPPMQL